MSDLKSYTVWDTPTRCFHWLNAICFFGLAGVGLVIYFANSLDVSNDGKVILKTVHVWIGYVFTVNIVFRLLWAFTGNRYARWSGFLPGGKGYIRETSHYLQTFLSGKPPQYLGHNPLGRLSVSLLLLLLFTQAVTGLVLAGTDLFFPPFGHWIAQWIAAPNVDPASLATYATDTYDATAYANMRAFRSPFVEIHEINFFILLVVAALHIAAVVMTELKERNGLVSAMITGRKVLDDQPADNQP